MKGDMGRADSERKTQEWILAEGQTLGQVKTFQNSTGAGCLYFE